MIWNRINNGPLREGEGGDNGGGGGAPAPAATPAGYHAYIGADGSFVADHADKAPPEIQPYATSIGRFKNVGELAKGYHELRQELGKRGDASYVRVPGEKSAPEEIAAYRKAVGAPEKPEEYGLSKVPEGMKPEEWNGAYGTKVEAILAKYHVPVAMARELAAAEQEMMREAALADEAAERTAAETREQARKQRWGRDYDANAEKVRQVREALGQMPLDDLLVKLHPLIQEDGGLVQKALGVSQLDVNGGNPKTRAMDIMQNPANPQHADYMGGNGPERQKAARARVHELLSQK